MRKHTTFTLCAYHADYFAGIGRYRLAEVFCEGGPAQGRSCTGKRCRVRPGSDIFGATATDDVADSWVRDWAVNR
jgi:hypothetical protein